MARGSRAASLHGGTNLGPAPKSHSAPGRVWGLRCVVAHLRRARKCRFSCGDIGRRGLRKIGAAGQALDWVRGPETSFTKSRIANVVRGRPGRLALRRNKCEIDARISRTRRQQCGGHVGGHFSVPRVWPKGRKWPPVAGPWLSTHYPLFCARQILALFNAGRGVDLAAVSGSLEQDAYS